MPLDDGNDDATEKLAERLHSKPIRREVANTIAYPTNFDENGDDISGELPIPDATRKRSPRIQDAARLYIHARICNFSYLGRQVGFNPQYLSKVARQDQWEHFSALLHKEQVHSVWRRSNPLEQHAKLLTAMSDEIAQRIAILASLQRQRGRIVKRMNDASIESTDYGKLTTNLSKVNREIDMLLGMKDVTDELRKIAKSYETEEEDDKTVDIILPSL